MIQDIPARCIRCNVLLPENGECPFCDFSERDSIQTLEAERDLILKRMDYAIDQHAKIMVERADLITERDQLKADMEGLMDSLNKAEAENEKLRDVLDDWRRTPGNKRDSAWWQQWDAKRKACYA